MKTFLSVIITLYILFELIILTAKCTVVYIIVKRSDEISDELTKNICDDFTHIYRKMFNKIKEKFITLIKPPRRMESWRQ